MFQGLGYSRRVHIFFWMHGPTTGDWDSVLDEIALPPQEELQRVFLATETLRREREEAMSPHPKKSKKQIGTKIGLYHAKV